jgi:predicted DNA-binding mobile mystery protein A
MSAADLGHRMGMSAPAVFALERREVQGGARLETLARAAEAMDCTLVYAFIPNRGLEKAVQKQAEKIVKSMQGYVDATMVLADQAVSDDGQDRIFQESLEALLDSSRNIWRE